MKNIISIFMIVLLVGCSASSKLVISNKSLTNRFDKQGHRGCRGLMPENTIPAFLKAIDMGVTKIEMDVIISKDKKVVVSHEPYFNYLITTKPDGTYFNKNEGKAAQLYDMDYAEILQYDVGMKPHPDFPKQQHIQAVKPLLTTVVHSVIYHMRTMRRPPVWYNIEIKSNKKGDGISHPAPAEFVDLVMATVREAGIETYTIIQSFDLRILQHTHRYYPQIKTSLLIEHSNKKSFNSNIEALGFQPTIYSPHQRLVTPELIKECHKAGALIIPWTVNSKKKINFLKNNGVDGIITDYPNLFYED